MNIKKVVETCVYHSDLHAMKDFYTQVLGLEFISGEPGRSVFLRAGKSMLLIFNPEATRIEAKFPPHGVSASSEIHLAFEIHDSEYKSAKELLVQSEVEIEKELEWGSTKSIYFRDPANNLVELITTGAWPTDD